MWSHSATPWEVPATFIRTDGALVRPSYYIYLFNFSFMLFFLKLTVEAERGLSSNSLRLRMGTLHFGFDSSIRHGVNEMQTLLRFKGFNNSFE